MSEPIVRRTVTRREFLRSTAVLTGMALSAMVIAPGVASAAAAAKPAALPSPSGRLKDVPRNRTVVWVRGGQDGKFNEVELYSPYATGSQPQWSLNHVMPHGR